LTAPALLRRRVDTGAYVFPLAPNV
jgi:hypothetical protein